jgi:ferredoxin-NADP reductase
MSHQVKIESIEHVTHDVLQIRVEKPWGFSFIPGQATEVSIDKSGWLKEKRPFTFTCLPDDDYLEFTIKTYPSRHGVTNELLQLKVKDELILHDVFGTIAYRGEGVFIAGGAGVTPFIAILRFLHSKNKIGRNKLIFANKTLADIINKTEFETILGNNFINILSDEKADGYESGVITETFIKSHSEGSDRIFYLCGPPPMMDAMEKYLSNLHVPAESIVKESF